MWNFSKLQNTEASSHNLVSKAPLNCWQAGPGYSQTIKSQVFLDLTSHLVVFILRIKSSAYPRSPSRHGSQTITESSLRMDVSVSAWIGGVPQKVGQFNYMCAQLSPPLKAQHLIMTLDVSSFPLRLPCFPGGSRASPVNRFDEVPCIVSCLGERTLRLVSVSNFNLSQL